MICVLSLGLIFGRSNLATSSCLVWSLYGGHEACMSTLKGEPVGKTILISTNESMIKLNDDFLKMRQWWWRESCKQSMKVKLDIFLLLWFLFEGKEKFLTMKEDKNGGNCRLFFLQQSWPMTAMPTMIRFQIRTSIAFGNLVGYLGSGWQKSIFNEFDNFNIDKFGSAQLLQQTLRWLVSARP